MFKLITLTLLPILVFLYRRTEGGFGGTVQGHGSYHASDRVILSKGAGFKTSKRA